MSRIRWIDRTRGILILCVLFFHVLGGFVHFALSDDRHVMNAVVKFIEVFNMPAFFLLSGFLWPAGESKLGSFIKRKARRLLIPYIFFGFIAAVMYMLLASRYQLRLDGWWQPFVSLVRADSWPDGNGFRFNSPLWFLPCLFVVECMYWIIDRFCHGRLSLIGLSLVLVLLANFLFRQMGMPRLPWKIDLAFGFLQYFIVGAMCARWRARMPFESSSRCMALFFLSVMVCLYVGELYILPTWNCTLKVFLMCWCVIFVGISFKGQGLECIGQYALGLMLVHRPVMSVLMLPLSLFLQGDHPVILFALAIMLFLVLTAISFSVTLGLKRFIPWAIGA